MLIDNAFPSTTWKKNQPRHAEKYWLDWMFVTASTPSRDPGHGDLFVQTANRTRTAIVNSAPMCGPYINKIEPKSCMRRPIYTPSYRPPECSHDSAIVSLILTPTPNHASGPAHLPTCLRPQEHNPLNKPHQRTVPTISTLTPPHKNHPHPLQFHANEIRTETPPKTRSRTPQK